MPKRKKNFIGNKKSALTFRLVHRSQKDPLIATDAGRHVLAPIGEHAESNFAQEFDSERRRIEQSKWGIEASPDDDYDYLQHLRDSNEVVQYGLHERFRVTSDGDSFSCRDVGIAIPAETATVTDKISKLRLPSSVFGSEGIELKTGLLNQAAPLPGPHPELDPDIVAALDDDFDFDNADNLLEDDFVVRANAHLEGETESDGEAICSDEDSMDGDLSDVAEGFEAEECKSRFTDYSISSSVIRRTEGLQKIDSMFEKLYEQYDEEEVGDLELDALDGSPALEGAFEPTSKIVQGLLDDYQRSKGQNHRLLDEVLADKDRIVLPTNDDSDEEKEWVDANVPKQKWDCESIISTYSTLYNHPTLIKDPPNPKKRRIEIDPKTGLPQETFNSKNEGLTPQKLKQLGVEDMDTSSVRTRGSRASTVRSKLETPQQKKLRKQAVRQERKERRAEKKANTLAFKEEKKKQDSHNINTARTSGTRLL